MTNEKGNAVNPYKNHMGIYFTQALFFESNVTDRAQAIYTLKGYDHEVDGKIYPSLRKLYVECEDPTEYIFATTYLDGWAHWKLLSSASFFKDHIKEWREELEIRLRAKALLAIREKAASKVDKEAFTANKFLVQGSWKSDEDKQKVGRPTKDKIKQEAEILFKAKTEIDDDYERIMN